jgi:hypothetical protein
LEIRKGIAIPTSTQQWDSCCKLSIPLNKFEPLSVPRLGDRLLKGDLPFPPLQKREVEEFSKQPIFKVTAVQTLDFSPAKAGLDPGPFFFVKAQVVSR